MIISISSAAKRFNVSRSKIYRMKENGQISFTKNSEDQVGIDLSEMLRVFGERKAEQPDNASKDNAEHDLRTENFYLKREIEALSQNLQKSESRVDQLLSQNQEQNKQFLLTQSKPEKSFWRNWWKA